MLTSLLNSSLAFSSSDYEEPQEAEVVTTEAPAPETQAPETQAPETQAPETQAPVTEAQTAESTPAETTQEETTASAETAETTGGETTPTETPSEIAASESEDAESETEKKTEKETETETETEVRENIVTFKIDDGAKVFIDDIDITKDTKEAKEAQKAIDGKIVFKVVAKEDYEITKVLVDELTDARKNEETVDEPDDYIIEGILTDSTVVTVKAKHKEKEVTVTYVAEDGGEISNTEETINLGDEDAAFEGSVATSTEDMLFTSWKDEEGEVVSNNEAFVPSIDEVKEDVTYTANFTEVDQVPAQDFEKTEQVNGLTVKVKAEKGIFPKDTTMEVEAVSREEAMNIAQAAADEDKEVTNAVAVDITFRDTDGKEIEPINEQAVKVEISLNKPLEGENFSVVHQADDGSVSKLTDAQVDANGAAFDATSFSIYAIIDENNPAIATYTFYDGTTKLTVDLNDDDKATVKTVDSQKVKNGETVYVPTTPEKDGYIFLGWNKDPEATVADSEYSPTGEFTANVTETGTVNLYAVYKKAIYVFFMDQYNRVHQTVVKEKGKPVDAESMTLPLPSDQAVTGWYKSEADAKVGSGATSVKIVTDDKEDTTLWPRIEKGNYLVFSTGEGASYIAPKFVPANEKTKKPNADEQPTRPGYEFAGWVTEQDGDESFTFGTTISEQTTAYAKWTPKQNTEYTVIVWKQSVNDDKGASDADKTYDFSEAFTLSGQTGATLNVDTVRNGLTLTKDYTGFHYNQSLTSSKAEENGTTIKGDKSTIINLYYDRDLMTLTFTWTESETNYEPENSYYYGRYGKINGEYVYLTYTYDYRYTPTTDNYGIQYGIVNGRYTQLTNSYGQWGYYTNSVWGRTWHTYTAQRYTRSDSREYIFYYNGKEYTDQRYRRTESSVQKTETYTGLYGQKFSDYNYNWPTDKAWYHSGSQSLSEYMDEFNFSSYFATHSKDMTLSQSGTPGRRTVNYYKQNLNDDDYDFTSPITAYFPDNLPSYGCEDRFTGFTLYQYGLGNTASDVRSWNEAKVQKPGEDNWITIGDNNIHILYKRNTYKLQFYSGGTIRQEASVKYEESLSGYKNYYEPDVAYRTEGLTDAYTFRGWYKDSACTVPFDFDSSTMPAGDVILYAKWAADEHEIHAHYDVNVDGELKKIRVQEGGSVNPNDLPPVVQENEDGSYTTIEAGDGSEKKVIVPKNNEWAGWSTIDENGNFVKYNFGDGVFKDLDLYPYYISTTKYHVTYDTNSGSGEVKDESDYASGSEAKVLSASGLIPPEGKVFLYWYTKDKDGNKGDIYYPHDKLHITDNVTLYAEYGDEGLVTTLTYHSNYPEIDKKANREEVHTISKQPEDGKPEKQFENNVQVTLKSAEDFEFSLSGYEFAGWAKAEDATEADFMAGEQVGLDTKNEADTNGQTPVKSDNHLYAVWKPVDVTITVKKLVTGNMGDKSMQFDFTATVSSSRTGWTANDGDDNFKLSNTQEKTIIVPKDSTITVKETAMDGYQTTITVNSNDVKAVNELMLDKDTTIIFTNERNVTAPTGVNVNNKTPLLLILSSLILLILSFFYIRRNRYELYE